MQPIASAPMVRRLLQEMNLSPNKLLGQNFLICEKTAQRIVQAAKINKEDNVVEIGPGLGALSEHMAKSAGYLGLLEIDMRLHSHLYRLFADNKLVEVMQGDALSFDYILYAKNKCWEDYLLVANLPYSITTPLLQYILLKGGPWRSLTLMMQKEFAYKLLPLSGKAAASPLALLMQYYGNINELFAVSKECFYPRPQVESIVIQITRHKQALFAVKNEEQFTGFLKAAFSHRRKTLLNSLCISMGQDAAWWREVFNSCGLGENKRAEQLTLAEYVYLFTTYERQLI
ncbi:MAG: 16S rRNA (adenine(1518)-N(6)/adenine(1519)-N(6))-dimethyltransferase RsmA [Firmicutes bacterium]|nr:16S rRNA (adenine(1518)-N(6)/adenine(1519)-N(6))-dimethyltransferase RsmA [Bacillota bacterium]